MNKNGIVQLVNKNKFLSEFLSEKAALQFRKFLIIGFTSFGLDYLIFIFLSNFMNIWYIYSNTMAFFISFWYNFLMNRYWSFESKNSFVRQLLLYGILFTVNTGLSNSLMYIITDFMGVSSLASKVIVIGVIALWNFIAYKKIIYR